MKKMILLLVAAFTMTGAFAQEDKGNRDTQCQISRTSAFWNGSWWTPSDDGKPWR